jgi:hypothetical protein
VAVRQQHRQTSTWVPLRHVTVKLGEEGRLLVESPYVSEGEVVTDERRRFTMGDRATLHDDGTFTLLERADRTVKVGGKRLSLPDMERELETHDWIDEAATLVFDQAAEARVHAVIVPSQIGRESLHTLGRREFGTTLGRFLAGHFDRVHLPRLWRIVDSLPRDTQGKLSAEALRAVFDSNGCDANQLGESRDAHSIERRLEVPADLAYLDGHFDGAPIVAGVVMLRWVMSAAEALRGTAPRIKTIEALKFPTPLRPGQRFTLRVETDVDTTRLDFHLRDDERVFATGRCRLMTPVSEPH